MRTINVTASRNYSVMIGAGMLREAGERIRAAAGGVKACIVTDDHVEPLYAERVESSLAAAGYETLRFVIAHGEASKSPENYIALLRFLAENRLTRTDILVALGGGVVGDLTGFAAASYLRGIPFVQLPTTVLAAVDSSVGGKTAIDLPEGKNLVGAFYQPHLVLCDTDTLATLPKETFEDGFAEIIKYGMLGDAELLKLLLLPVEERLEEILAVCVEMKRDVVAEDEFDHGKRQLLNLGHTVGHAIEALSGYRQSHGRAVAAGMCIVTEAAVRHGICPKESLDILRRLCERFELPQTSEYTVEQMYEIMTADKKRAGNRIHLIVPNGFGSCEIRSMEITELKAFLA